MKTDAEWIRGEERRWAKYIDDSKMELTPELARMCLPAFDDLAEYSSSLPSGVFVNKIWKRHQEGQWWLGQYLPHPTDSTYAQVVWRRIKVWSPIESGAALPATDQQLTALKTWSDLT